MGFPWRQILAGVKIGAGVAAGVVTGGAAAPVIALIPSLVETVESAFSGQPGSGEKKKMLVLQMSLFSIAAAEGISQKDLVEDEAAMDAIDAIIEGCVAFDKAIKARKK